jgi:3-deoxy-D-manno-octulosonic-acid transferase
VNGRLSERSARRFRRLRPLALPLLETLVAVCVQVPVYAQRFLSVGIGAARLHVTGNMKFDNIPQRRTGASGAALRALLCGDGREPLLVAGSTHPDEELVLAGIRRRLAARGLAARLVVAPRHPARAATIVAQLERHGFDVVRRSDLGGPVVPRADQVVLLDTVGELEGVYALADAVFVGGSLVPHGGQNVMEPASVGRPVVVGPNVWNFRGEVDMLLQAEGLRVAGDAAGVEAALAAWLEDPAAAAALGSRARAAIEASKGATANTLAVLRPWLEALEAGTALPLTP